MRATRILSRSAVDFITSGGRPASVIAARYPDAPALPTEE
jgi:hypothetical protein